MPIRKGDLLLYTYDQYPQGHGSIAIAIRDEYNDPYSKDSHRGVDVEWLSASTDIISITDFNIDCFKVIGHIDVPKHPRRKKS